MAAKTGAKKRATIVGGGPVGALQAVYLGQRGYDVDVYENRTDIRKAPEAAGYSINLALSERGRTALRRVGLEDEVVRNGIPMYARMLHDEKGNLARIPYSSLGEAILAIDRKNLNELLLTAAEKMPNVKLHFEHKLASVDVKATKAEFTTPTGATASANADVIIGCDGAHSSTRRAVMRETRMDYSQTYLPHGYKELCIPASPDNGFQMQPDCLHIWPRHTFMMIALPNLNKTFTVTLFMPFEQYDKLKTDQEIMAFFEKYFADAIPLMGPERLLHDFKTNPTSPLILIKCTPYFKNRTVFMGDAAHAMVPFYGQGMNAGFEDVNIFNGILDQFSDDLDKVLESYSATRHKDAVAICDLAMYNYIEMRDLVTNKWFLFRKKIDGILHRYFPTTFIPLYSMVTFSNIPYSEVIIRNNRQRYMVNLGLATVGMAAVAGIATAAVKFDLASHVSAAFSKAQEHVASGLTSVLKK